VGSIGTVSRLWRCCHEFIRNNSTARSRRNCGHSIAHPNPNPSGFTRNLRNLCARSRKQLCTSARLSRGLPALPFDITGAVLTGRTTYEGRWEHVYNRAYADCRATGRTAMLMTPSHDYIIVEPTP